MVAVCRKPGCPELRPCPIDGHEPKPWAGTTRNANRATSGWAEQKLNRRILAAHPDCYLCGAPATLVDHVTNLAAGGADTRANRRPICEPCHTAKTKAEALRGRNP